MKKFCVILWHSDVRSWHGKSKTKSVILIVRTPDNKLYSNVVTEDVPYLSFPARRHDILLWNHGISCRNSTRQEYSTNCRIKGEIGSRITAILEVGWTKRRAFLHRVWPKVDAISSDEIYPLFSCFRVRRKLMHSYPLCIGSVLARNAIWRSSDAVSSTSLHGFLLHLSLDTDSETRARKQYYVTPSSHVVFWPRARRDTFCPKAFVKSRRNFLFVKVSEPFLLHQSFS